MKHPNKATPVSIMQYLPTLMELFEERVNIITPSKIVENSPITIGEFSARMIEPGQIITLSFILTSPIRVL
ncbi:MAG: hypothetical protein ACFFEN_02390 [Candidatus Thorarchaeota archaeon]